MLNAIVVGAYSCYIVCTIIVVWFSPNDVCAQWLSWSMSSKLVTVQACRYVAYIQARNLVGVPQHTKCETLPDYHRENEASPSLHSHVDSLVRIAFCVLWHKWDKALPDFCHENKLKYYWILVMVIWQRLQTDLESIDRDHTHPKTKPQSPTHLKPRNLMPITCFQLPMS